MATFFETNAQKINQWSRTRRNGAKPSGVVVLHTAESATDFLGPDPGAENVARYFATTNRYASYHHLSDADSSIQLAPWSAETWHDTGTNNHSVGISAAIQCKDWKALGARGELIVKRMAAGAASYAKWLKANRGITIPASKITRAQARAKVPGFLGHGTSDPGRRSDPGADFDWDLFFREFTRLMSGAVEPVSSKPSKPAAKPSVGGGSVVDWLAAKGRDSSYAARARLAAQYGIKGYKGTAAQNTALLAKLKGGAPAPAPAAKPKPKPAPAPSGKTVEQMAAEVIAGKHGNGHDVRRKSLGISAAEYAKVREAVNGGSKSIADMATEILQGKHGNGHPNRQKSLGVNNATYAKVRAEVNRRA